jgi:DMSO/TMAO reductase YedYZ heme-binding membrane subunit
MDRKGYLLAACMAALFVGVSAAAVMRGGALPTLAVRLFALNGFVALAIAASMSPFLREIRQIFGRPFIYVHHVFAAFGLISILLHPVAAAVTAGSLSVFIPVFSSIPAFLALGGRVAFYLILIALTAAVLRNRYPSVWRSFHMLMYAALALGIVHATLIGTDLANPGIRAVLYALFVAVMAALLLKRRQRYLKSAGR